MRVLVNGLGCPYTGSRFVLDQLLKAAPSGNRIVAIVPVVNGGAPFQYPPNVKLIKLKHSVWGKYLRILVEMSVNIAMLFRRFDRLINLSNYGLCFTGRQVLYIHNPMILDISAEKKFGEGNPNILIRKAMHTFLRRGEAIFVQTDHMYRALINYCRTNSIPVPRSVTTLRPPFPDVKVSMQAPVKQFGFQFFYPASNFPHKRANLAMDGVRAAREQNDQVGLAITVDGSEEPGIRHLGQVAHSEVYQQFINADALLFTSERETLGLPLLEAIYFEKPAVLPDMDYAREIYGDAAVYYKGNNAEAVANAIRTLVENYSQYARNTSDRKRSELMIRKSWTEHWGAFLNNA
jgi:glycosyltransferase involved in cell wall biosynthesis